MLWSMDLRRLRYFVALAEDLHFTRAAQRLLIAQPALSQAVRQLEREMHVELFRRTRRHVELTPAGATLLEDARKILADVDAAVKRAQAAQHGREETLRIGFSDAAVTRLLPTLLRDYARRHPDIEILLHPLSNAAKIAAALEAGDIDLGVSGLVGNAALDQAFTFLPLDEEPMALALPADHPLSKLDVVDLATLETADIVLPLRSANPPFHDALADVWHAAGVTVNVVGNATTLHTLYSFVASGMGIAILPSRAHWAGASTVVFRPTVQELPLATLGVVWDESKLDPTMRSFVDLARELDVYAAASSSGPDR